MNEITQDKVKELFEYRDGALFWKVSSNNFIQVGQQAGTAINDSGYHIVGINGKTYRLHRIIFMYHHGYFPKNVDHIDGDAKNNKPDNLRILCPNCHAMTSTFGNRNKNSSRDRS